MSDEGTRLGGHVGWLTLSGGDLDSERVRLGGGNRTMFLSVTIICNYLTTAVFTVPMDKPPNSTPVNDRHCGSQYFTSGR